LYLIEISLSYKSFIYYSFILESRFSPLLLVPRVSFPFLSYKENQSWKKGDPPCQAFIPNRRGLELRSGRVSSHKAVSPAAGRGGNGSDKIHVISLRDSPRGREVYRELLELKEKHRASWAMVLAMLLDAYRKLEGRRDWRDDSKAPGIPEQPFSIYVLKSKRTYTLYSNVLMRHAVQEPYWMHKYIGRRLLYIIVARTVLYKVVGRVFEERGEGNTRKYVLADIRVMGTWVPSKEALDSIKKSIWAKVNELCRKDPTCRGIDIEPELNRIHRIVR
jgi:hypothetical protein